VAADSYYDDFSYVTAEEATTDGSGYTQKSFRYEHPFPRSTLNNIGLNVDFQACFGSGLIIGQELSRTFSIKDHSSVHQVNDTLDGSGNSSIPADYRKQSYRSDDRLYLKSLLWGFVLGYRIPMRDKVSISALAGLGAAFYRQVFQIEKTNVAVIYHQQNGHQVYKQKQPDSFDVFDIYYRSFYVRPQCILDYRIARNVSLRVGASVPISYVDQGIHYSDGYGPDMLFYPHGRFVAGNAILHLGVRIHLNPGDDDNEKE
jgi:hypothetical protein